MRFPRSLVALPVALTLGLTLAGTSAVADPPDPPGTKASPVGQDHRAEQAEEALANVEDILAGHAARRGGSSSGEDLTIALQQLRVLKDALSPADQEKARPYFLYRPGDPGDPYIPGALPLQKCSTDICVHYTETGNNAPNGSDGDAATTPPYINLVRDTMQQIHDDFLGAGYRPEKGDGSIGGGTDRTDVYIGDIGDEGIYGFCSSDDPNDPAVTSDYSVWAYCALDDDYDASEFPTNTPTENMQVTAAHEYFHAVQFAYDGYEDPWIMESTAAWVEDEMFDAVDDNRQYLGNSPLGMPFVPLDTFGDGFHYGTWIWWRYLTEKFPAKVGKLPKLVLDVWKRLDGTPSAADDYSTQGMSRVLAARNTSLKRELQLFSAANRHPRTVYSEGNAYSASPTGLTLGFNRAQRKGANYAPAHLASGTVRLNPNGLSQRDWKLRLAFDAPKPTRGGAFVVVVYKRGGGITTSIAQLNPTGGGGKTVPFSSRTVDHVDVIFVNTSARFDCWQEATPYSCFGGIPLDDGLKSAFTARSFRS
ncbi:hypothetical protein D0Z08_11345 [Nocardioides immobilis]|uniref:Uncharacterized protein n=1 Tax=Nocardioides immobilis TaxID=2049295 RepID=A0A417Y2M1_9ACTN|nr:MXAN_6640 family putative metalloprotease [Nocardioides immobilis]RHW26794.1 hypothetical protein D0Z08_11345 [Nocardioides immobilis]